MWIYKLGKVGVLDANIKGEWEDKKMAIPITIIIYL
jgi:hypothetical protein